MHSRAQRPLVRGRRVRSAVLAHLHQPPTCHSRLRQITGAHGGRGGPQKALHAGRRVSGSDGGPCCCEQRCVPWSASLDPHGHATAVLHNTPQPPLAALLLLALLLWLEVPCVETVVAMVRTVIL